MKCILGLILLVVVLLEPAQAEVTRVDSSKLVTAARAQVGVTTSYDPAYRPLSYPGGDVPMGSGVCSDVVIRAFRVQRIDLQKEVHEDMNQNFSLYPKQWGLAQTDKNIDHRRVPNLMVFFKRQGWQEPISSKASEYFPGDIVTWNLRSTGSLPHIGIVSDRKNGAGQPLVIHNIGQGAREEEGLFAFTITGHYRPK